MEEKTKDELIQEENKAIIEDFRKYLTKKYNNPRIIKKHLDNIHLLINDYLAVDFEIKPTEADSSHMWNFLDWCITHWIFNTSSELISIMDSTKIFFEYLPNHNNLKEKEEILKICDEREYYLKKFNEQEKLLGDY